MVMHLKGYSSVGIPASRILQCRPWAFVWSTLENKVLSMFFIARFYLKCYSALFSKWYSFISSSFNRINPAEMPIFYQYSTSDQPVFVRNLIVRHFVDWF